MFFGKDAITIVRTSFILYSARSQIALFDAPFGLQLRQTQKMCSTASKTASAHFFRLPRFAPKCAAKNAQFVTALSIFFISLSVFAGQTPSKEHYFATESGNRLEVITPEGKKKIIWGDFTLPSERHYRLEIPLESLGEPFELGDKKPEKTEEEKAEEKKQAPVGAKEQEPKKLIVEYDDSDRLVVEANVLFNQGRYYEATIYVEELIRKNPEYARAWAMKGSLMYVQGYKDLAKKAWEKALKLEPNNQEIAAFLKRTR